MQIILLFMRSKRDVRRAVVAGVLLLLLIGWTIYGSGNLKRQSLLDDLDGRLSARVGANADVLAHQIDQLRRDVRFLASVPPVVGLVRASEDGGVDSTENTPAILWQRRLESIFQAYVMANPDVFQVRLIGVAGHGRELVRIERTAGRIAVVAPEKLQEKGDTDYVMQTSGLQAQQVYVSEVNLNREQGTVQVPNVATLRVATPVLSSHGQVVGMVVINFDVNAILGQLQANLPAHFQSCLVNARGDFFLQPIHSRRFGFGLRRRWRWQDEFWAIDVPDPRNLSGLQRFGSLSGLPHDGMTQRTCTRLANVLPWILTGQSGT